MHPSYPIGLTGMGRTRTMAPPTASAARQWAEATSGDMSLVEGPLRGYHHETYVLWLPDGSGRVKVRAPRAEALWFDRRCFRSEEELLRSVRPYLPRVPEVLDIGGVGVQRFIEGRTLGARRPGRRVPEPVLEQIAALFRDLAAIGPALVTAPRRCSPEDAPRDGDSDGFLRRLIVFIQDQVYERHRAGFAGLFRELGIVDETLARLEKNVSGLADRPFCLLHADLHRENLVLDPDGRLWAIDWELAMIGDPLYDLATHLYLMDYRADQRDRLVRAWCEAVESVRPGGTRQWRRDLRLITDFKCAQSVFTDVVRVSLSLRDASGPRWAALPGAAARLQRIILRAARPLGLDEVPGTVKIMAALARWLRHLPPRTTHRRT